MIAGEPQIRALAAAMEAAWERRDAAGFARPFSTDADFTSVRGERRRGRSEIAASHADLLQTVYSGTKLRLRIEHLRSLGRDLAAMSVVSTLYRADGSPVTGLGGPGGNLMHALAIAENRSGTWQIIIFHNMVPLVPAAASRAERALADSSQGRNGQ